MLELYDAAIAAASPGAATARAVDALSIDRASRVWIFAFGKAATPMATAAVASLLRSLHAIVGGVVVSHRRRRRLHIRRSSPCAAIIRCPARNSFAAAAKIAEVSAGRRGNDVAIVLISGGASSLIGAPLRGMNEADLIALYELLLGSGLDIAAMNAVRKRFSRWGARTTRARARAGGDALPRDLRRRRRRPRRHRLGTVRARYDDRRTTSRDSAARRICSTRIPQTYRDYLTSVGRGTIPETPTKAHPAFAHVTARVIGNNRLAVDGIAAHARANGLDVDIVDDAPVAATRRAPAKRSRATCSRCAPPARSADAA